jgi:hypothetical protein
MRARAAAIVAELDPKARDQLRKDLSAETTCTVCKGVGYTTQRRADRASAMDSMFTTVRCGRCRGCGESVSPSDASAEREDRCLACGGAAYIVPVSVKERGSTKSGRAPRREAAEVGDYIPGELTNSEPDRYVEGRIEDLVDQRRAAKGLDQALSAAPDLAPALHSYLGPEGDRWVNHRWGRAFTLWQHTAAGKALAPETAALSARGSWHLLDTTELLALTRDDYELGRLPNTRDGARARVLLGRADHEARVLLQRLETALAEVEAVA